MSRAFESDTCLHQRYTHSLKFNIKKDSVAGNPPTCSMLNPVYQNGFLLPITPSISASRGYNLRISAKPVPAGQWIAKYRPY
ncbi:unnamed protein product [Boreogadus saida]